jgi:hypothetical protein
VTVMMIAQALDLVAKEGMVWYLYHWDHSDRFWRWRHSHDLSLVCRWGEGVQNYLTGIFGR